jgi:hypothetical protein
MQALVGVKMAESSLNITRDSALKSLERFLAGSRAAVFEGDIFAILLACPYVVRSFEFAVADGALDCSKEYSTETGFADRLWKVEQDLRSDSASHKLLLFDVKSSSARDAGEQVYITTIKQRRHVAFYLGVCASDPGFVELIPNLLQGFQGQDDDTREVAVNSSRKLSLHPTAYRLDPFNAPYRMPIPLLPRALESVRLCAQGKRPYRNPWTLVLFPQWSPKLIQTVEPLRPYEGSEHFTSYREVMEIRRMIKTRAIQDNLSVDFDFVGVQPRLADFKIVLPSADGQSCLQVFVQHKLDGRDRAISTPLTKVAIARGKEGGTSWYFSPFQR